eukprot:TRINITY_DN8033_c0_g1_i2.p1 TRINITY_DN8033_c0_g1~~TRINITY_DN8033_c0_g1_i2.p1  ORF type:complete len:207 (-),score=11.51 TRINITY_DN8033_c0_g1_i2:3-623(-)
MLRPLRRLSSLLDRSPLRIARSYTERDTVKELYQKRSRDLSWFGIPRVLYFIIPPWVYISMHPPDEVEEAKPPYVRPFTDELLASAFFASSWSTFRSARYLKKHIPQYSDASILHLFRTPLSRQFLQRNAVMAPLVGFIGSGIIRGPFSPSDLTLRDVNSLPFIACAAVILGTMVSIHPYTILPFCVRLNIPEGIEEWKKVHHKSE